MSLTLGGGAALAADNTAAKINADAINSIDHIIVIYQENWTFDGLYGSFPRADGLANAATENPASLIQLDKLTGTPLSAETGVGTYNDQSNTVVVDNPPAPLSSNSSMLDAHFLNSDGTTKFNTLVPYALTDPVLSLGIDPTYITGDIYHRYWQEQFQINHGANNLLVSWSDNPGLVMSHFDASNLPEGLLAQQYTMFDNFFHSAFGGSFLNHQFLVAGAAPVYPNAATVNAKAVATLDAKGVLALDNNGKLVHDGSITPIGGVAFTNPTVTFDQNYVVNTTYSVNLATSTTSFTNGAPPASLLPSLNDSNATAANYEPNIGDLLDAKSVSWKWYSGGWDNALASSPSNPAHYGSNGPNTVDPLFQWHHQPLAYFDHFAPFVSVAAYTANPSAGPFNPTSAAHLQDETQFFSDVTNNTLPAVSFIKPVGENNEHPGYAALQVGQNHVASLVQAVQANPALWAHTAIIITYDEHGGRWDHVAPPARDIWGPGQRVPAILISPYAQPGMVDHTSHDTSAILRTIEDRFDLGTLSEAGGKTMVDANSTTLFDSLTTLSIARSSLTQKKSGKFVQTLTVTNIGKKAVAGPISFVLVNLAPGTTLANATGTTLTTAPKGSPYITAFADGKLAPGASASVKLRFDPPTSGGLDYQIQTVVDTATP